MTSPTADRAKKLARLLREDLGKAGVDIPHSLALELIAHQLGTKDWNVLAALTSRAWSPAAPDISPGVPVLRVMSVAQALPFHLDYLGFALDREHRFEPGMPLYVRYRARQPCCTSPNTTATAPSTAWSGSRCAMCPPCTRNCSPDRMCRYVPVSIRTRPEGRHCRSSIRTAIS